MTKKGFKMATAFTGYSFGFVAPGQTVGVDLHGFPLNVFAAIDVHVYQTSIVTGTNADVDVHSLGQHIDGTLFHTIWVTNTTTGTTELTQNPVADVTLLYETLQ
jgi:hypothetical protein